MNFKSFSNEQLTGQRLMVGFDGTDFNDDLRYLIDTLKIGGVILFSRNITTPEKLGSLCFSIQEYAKLCGQPELFISIDQEGGTVARLKEPFTQFPGNPYMKGESDAVEFAHITASEFKKVGINMNMAPVMDVPPENFKSVMDDRVFGKDPFFVSQMGVTVIDHLQKNGIMSVAKHFPGIGRTTLDSHVDMPFLDTPRHEMEITDFVPFEAAIKHNVSGIMLSHILYSHIDPDWPASLSSLIVKDLLRDKMGYNGVVMTDDLDMGSIKKRYDIKTIIPRILVSEIDVVLICHKGPGIQTSYETILNMCELSEELKFKNINSVERIITLKRSYL